MVLYLWTFDSILCGRCVNYIQFRYWPQPVNIRLLGEWENISFKLPVIKEWCSGWQRGLVLCNVYIFMFLSIWLYWWKIFIRMMFKWVQCIWKMLKAWLDFVLNHVLYDFWIGRARKIEMNETEISVLETFENQSHTMNEWVSERDRVSNHKRFERRRDKTANARTASMMPTHQWMK